MTKLFLGQPRLHRVCQQFGSHEQTSLHMDFQAWTCSWNTVKLAMTHLEHGGVCRDDAPAGAEPHNAAGAEPRGAAAFQGTSLEGKYVDV